MVTIRDENLSDIVAREALLDSAMGAGRFDKPSERLREGRLPARGLSLCAEHEGALVGTVRLWSIAAGTAGEGLLLGPLAVDAAHRSLGVGARLMREALWRAARTGQRFVLLVGDAPYYERFGFERAPAGLAMPGPTDPARFLAFTFRPEALIGAAGEVVATGVWAGDRRGLALAA
jgi:predicted N-acetyltransferase YhbS